MYPPTWPSVLETQRRQRSESESVRLGEHESEASDSMQT